eukprot:8072481-Heterocapsa_arctica.AAC.1
MLSRPSPTAGKLRSLPTKKKASPILGTLSLIRCIVSFLRLSVHSGTMCRLHKFRGRAPVQAT